MKVKVAIPKRDITFCDGTTHRRGQRVDVTPENEAYFESKLGQADYDIVEIDEAAPKFTKFMIPD